ncbi:MAG: pyridoxal-phosphate dependent enzyme [Sediminibacterium sp.]|nr:pyridoxal-phosphate dependent enzyme [Sediminibacterium sp.]
MIESLEKIAIQHLPHFSTQDVQVDILRLDLLHPIVSGNKWFKLKYYLEDALAQNKKTIATFGGAYSNHIVATAYAAKEAGLQSIGFIRGEISATPSATLRDASNYGMDLVFIERELYRDKEMIMLAESKQGFYWVMEGGYGEPGSKGAADILQAADTRAYSHILCAAGTGTMLSGLVRSALPGQEIIGISVLKNHMTLEKEVLSLLTNEDRMKPFSILHNYHFGGYAKHPPELIAFMRDTWAKENVPTDIVYTSKLLFAAKDLIAANRFPGGARILLIHSGGLQGNTSLPPNTLPFS